MKNNYYRNFFIVTFLFTIISSSNISAQKRNDQLLNDTLANINRLLYKSYQHCFLNPKDSAEAYISYDGFPDTIPYLRYSTPSRLKYVQFEIDSIIRLSKKAKKEKSYQEIENSDFKDLSGFEIERRYGIIWKIADIFDTTLCSNDYDFRVKIRFDVNCNGNIYNIKIMDSWLIGSSKYHLTESYNFAFAVYKLMLILRDNIVLNPAIKKGEKNLNYHSIEIEISSKRKKVFVSQRLRGKDIRLGCCYTTNQQLR